MKIILIVIFSLIMYTARQSQAQKLFNQPDKMYYLCDGGSRSGKTWVICKYMVKYATKYKGVRLLICRQSKTSCISTVWSQTLLKVLENENSRNVNYDKFWHEDKSNRIIKFANGSEIRAGGFDNKIHEDAVLGSEYAIIFVNEAIDLSYIIFNKLRSRLNWKGLKLKFFLDCNPKAPSHWVSKFFLKNIEPENNEKLDNKISNKTQRIRFHPLDNKEYLSPEYLEQLENLRGLAKKRFWDGEWAEDLEGLVYTSFERKINVVDEPIKLIPEAETFTTWDFGVSDPTFIIIGQILQVPKSPDNKEGLIINIIDEYINKNKEAAHYARYLNKKEYVKCKTRRDYGDPAGQARNAALQSWISLLWPFGFQIQYTSIYSIDEQIDCANKIMHLVRVCEKQCPKTVEMFENWKYPLDNDGKKKVGSKPEHDIFSHPGTAFYYFACNRFGTKQGELII